MRNSIRHKLRLRFRRGRHEQGAAVVEAAIITPLFFMFILAIFEFGPLFFQFGSVKNGVSEGVRLASIAGSSASADYDTIQSMRNSLKNLGAQLDYVIVYKAQNMHAGPPTACKAAAELGMTGVSATAAVGVFNAGNSPAGIPWTPETFDFGIPRAINDPITACNVYYRRMFSTPKAAWIYDRSLAIPTPPALPQFSLDRYYPGSVRIDYQSGPQDYVGVYVQSQYKSPTGMFSARKVRNFGVVRIEPVRANK
jgi:TadE-like protein